MASTFRTRLVSGDDTESGQALDLVLDEFLAESVPGLLGVVAYIGSIIVVAINGIRTLLTAGVVDDVGRPSVSEHLRGGVLIQRDGHGWTSRQLLVMVRCS